MIMMTQNTQGPWFHKDHSSGRTYIYPKSGLNPICEIFTGYEENQHLIAAAPELLRELESAIFYIENYGGEVTQNFASGGNLLAIKAIIAKAKGE